MTDLILWKNQEINRLRRDMAQTLRQWCNGFGVPYSLLPTADVVSIDLSESEKELVLTAELPNATLENIDISVGGNTVRLRVERQEETFEDGKDFQQVARRSGHFSRSITLPCRIDADASRATFNDGTLTITMPKRDPETQMSRRIKIK